MTVPTYNERRRVNWVLDWCERMAKRFGGTVYEKRGHSMDWGQALARECYGKDWLYDVPENPTWADIEKAKAWEAGKIPEWVDMESVGGGAE